MEWDVTLLSSKRVDMVLFAHKSKASNAFCLLMLMTPTRLFTTMSFRHEYTIRQDKTQVNSTLDQIMLNTMNNLGHVFVKQSYVSLTVNVFPNDQQPLTKVQHR